MIPNERTVPRAPAWRLLRGLPNLITALRLALVLPIAALLWWRADLWALAAFLVAALSDFADGWLARRWRVESRFGAVADPVADKLTMLVTAGVLTVQADLPVLYLAAVALRDLVIVGGATVWHLNFGTVEMAPTRLSKLNTLLHFLLLLGAIAVRAGLLPDLPAWDVLMGVAIAGTIASGVQYVWIWGHRAAGARTAGRRP